MKKSYLFYIAILLIFIIGCGPSKPEEEVVDETAKNGNMIIFRYDSNELVNKALKHNKVDLLSKSVCPKIFNGCCIPNGISTYYNGIYQDLFNISSALNRNIVCDIWLHYKSDDGQILAMPVEYQKDRNMLKVDGIYFECISSDNQLWVPNLNYFHSGWPSETFDYVMDFAPSKFIRFKQQFCRSLGIPTTLKVKNQKLFHLEVTENQQLKIYSEAPFDDLTIEYKDIATGIENFVDYYYFDRLDYLRDKLVNVSFLVRDNETLYPVEDANVVILPLEGTDESREIIERFTDFTLRAPNFDFGLYGFKNCISENVLDRISMQNKLFTYFTDYRLNPWAIISSKYSNKTNKNGELYWNPDDLASSDPNTFSSLIKSELFKTQILNRAHYFAIEKNKRYSIKIVHPRYQYFERTFSVSEDSQVIIDLAQVTTKLENVGGRGNRDNLFIRPILE